MSPAPPLALAIDFGTANSVAVTFDGHDFDKVTDSSGRFIMPSSVFLDRDGWLVGWDALQIGLTDPDRYKAGLKRELDVPGTIPLGEGEFLRTDLIGVILRFFHAQAKERSGRHPDAAVLTVPAAYDEYSCQLMIEAAHAAGFDAATTTEPVAAAFSEGAAIGSGLLLVYDLGAGTFDAALVQSDGVRSHVVGHGGLSNCGGLDIDQLVYSHLRGLAEHPEQVAVLDGTDTTAQGRARRLQFRDECRQKKELLSSIKEVRSRSLALDPPLEYTITRDWLEEAERPLLLDSIGCCRELLGESGVEAADLDHVLLVGGSTRAPLVRMLIEQELGCEVRRARVPETAVAEGASRWAWNGLLGSHGTSVEPPSPAPGTRRGHVSLPHVRPDDDDNARPDADDLENVLLREVHAVLTARMAQLRETELGHGVREDLSVEAEQPDLVDVQCAMCNGWNRVGGSAPGYTCRGCGMQTVAASCSCGETVSCPISTERDSPFKGSSWRHEADGIHNVAMLSTPEGLAVNCNRCGAWNRVEDPEATGVTCHQCLASLYYLTCGKCTSEYLVTDPRVFFSGVKELTYECDSCHTTLTFTTVRGGPPKGLPVPLSSLLEIFPVADRCPAPVTGDRAAEGRSASSASDSGPDAPSEGASPPQSEAPSGDEVAMVTEVVEGLLGDVTQFDSKLMLEIPIARWERLGITARRQENLLQDVLEVCAVSNDEKKSLGDFTTLRALVDWICREMPAGPASTARPTRAGTTQTNSPTRPVTQTAARRQRSLDMLWTAAKEVPWSDRPWKADLRPVADYWPGGEEVRGVVRLALAFTDSCAVTVTDSSLFLSVQSANDAWNRLWKQAPPRNQLGDLVLWAPLADLECLETRKDKELVMRFKGSATMRVPLPANQCATLHKYVDDWLGRT